MNTHEVTTTAPDGCKMIYTHCDGEVLSICIIDVLGRFSPARESDWKHARRHLANCVRGVRA